jgi:lipopolysaccharide export system protein LptA
MALSISRLRGVLIAGATLLLLVLAAYIGLGRYKSLQIYQRLIKRTGVTLTHDTNGFTYSQSLQGRTVFLLHAAKATQLGSGKYALHNAELTLYDRVGQPQDHIRASEIDYDEQTEEARALGVVDMDLLPPQGLANGGRATADAGKTAAAKRADALNEAEIKAAPAQPVHVRTSGLIYQRKLGTASTDQRVDFVYGGMQCTAVGAEFNNAESRLRLLAQVRMEGTTHGKPMHVTAASAEMDRENNVAKLERPTVSTDDRSAAADDAVLTLRKDGSIERLQAGEHVMMRSLTQEITAARLDATLNAQTLPEKARLSGGVVLSGTDSLRPMHGSAATMDAVFNAAGVPTLITADGGAKLSMADMRVKARGLTRSMEGTKIVATFVPGQRRGSAQLSEVHATGGAHAEGQSIAAAPAGNPKTSNGTWLLKTTQVAGDDLRLTFVAGAGGKAEANKLYAAGKTQLRQDGPLDAQETSSGDTLELAFAPNAKGSGSGGYGIETAVQAGHVVIHNHAAGKPGSAEPGAVSDATADRAVYDGATQRLTLLGAAHLDGDNASVSAPVVVLDQVTQDAEAHGGVQATLESARKNAAAKVEPPTHVLAASATFEHAAKVATFFGTDAQPARMWQDASQVQAARLTFDGVRRTFSARPVAAGALMHAVFAGAAAAPKPGAAVRPANIVRVASEKMDYNDLRREATFSGAVTMDSGQGELHGQRGVVFLAPAKVAGPTAAQARESAAAQPNPFSGSIDRVVLSGGVRLEQPGRQAFGEQLLYTAATGDYVLTGTPAVQPRVIDAQQGSVTGAVLSFSDAGSTIVVAGDVGAGNQGGRVRSEMSVRQKKDERQ